MTELNIYKSSPANEIVSTLPFFELGKNREKRTFKIRKYWKLVQYTSVAVEVVFVFLVIKDTRESFVLLDRLSEE